MDRNKIEVKKATESELEKFFINNKSNFFRYYDKRNYDHIKFHVYSALYFYEDKIFGYGHIDFEEKNWLGIFIAEEFRGKKLSKYIIDDLLEKSPSDVYLTVDLDNIKAINLYKQMKFEIIEKKDSHYLMVYKKK